MKLVQQITALPRQSPERSRLFYQMHARLADLQMRPEFHQWEQNLAEAQNRLSEEQDLFDRELFYALQPRARLHQLIERYHAHFS
jgi:hypothetical protein